jgi:cell division protein FtsB
VHQALEDVNFYGTRLRKVEINDILPIIEQDRYQAMVSQRNWLFAATGLAVALLLGILLGYWYIHKKNRKLTEARETIHRQLDQLQEKNQQLSTAIHQLQEANKIKNEYIGRSFYTNAQFIAKLEKLYMALDRKITARQYDDLRTTLKQSTLNAERENMFESFDQTFLKLFPQFVAKYNELFDEKDRKEPANDHSLTSEMRIFALIRLGITDSDRIANFLDYSVHTVNTYKTRIKNRSKVDNDQFEQLIMEI